jgi:hypothetical protein
LSEKDRTRLSSKDIQLTFTPVAVVKKSTSSYLTDYE